MAATKFSVVKENKNTGKILIINYAGEWTYKTALAIAKEANQEFNEKEWRIVCVVETKSLYRDWETDRKSTRLNSSHRSLSRMPSSA